MFKRVFGAALIIFGVVRDDFIMISIGIGLLAFGLDQVVPLKRARAGT